MSTPSDLDAIVGEAVLIDYPLHLWERQQDHTRELLREFTLMLGGMRTGTTASPPQLLIQLAQDFQGRYGQLMASLDSARQAELDAGRDRMDWRLPLMQSMPALLQQVHEVLTVVDAYCASGELLALSRSDEQVAFQAWVRSEILSQLAGGAPAPWTGPFA